MSDQALVDWLNQLAREMNGFFGDEENNLYVDPGDGMGCNTYAYREIVQMYRSRYTPREAADLLRYGGTQ